MILDTIQEICRRDGETLLRAGMQDAVARKVFELDIDDLADFSHDDIRKSEKHQSLFAELATKPLRGPALYLFELLPDADNSQILARLEAYRNSTGGKAVPAMRKNAGTDSAILYVGKVKKDFWGRLIQHLGFYRNGRTQGLQLYHWMRGSGAKVRVHMYVFPEEMAQLMGAIEVQVAQQLQPLVGKHK